MAASMDPKVFTKVSGGYFRWGVIYCLLQSDSVSVCLAAAQEEVLGPEGGFVGGSDEERAFGDVFEDEDVRAERIAMQAGAGSCHTIFLHLMPHMIPIVESCSGGGCQAATGFCASEAASYDLWRNHTWSPIPCTISQTQSVSAWLRHCFGYSTARRVILCLCFQWLRDMRPECHESYILVDERSGCVRRRQADGVAGASGGSGEVVQPRYVAATAARAARSVAGSGRGRVLRPPRRKRRRQNHRLPPSHRSAVQSFPRRPTLWVYLSFFRVLNALQPALLQFFTRSLTGRLAEGIGCGHARGFTLLRKVLK